MDFDAGSFRDRGGRVFRRGDQVYRALSAAMLEDWQVVSACDFFRRRMAEGDIVASELLDHVQASGLISGSWAGVLRHDPLPMISYPYEWTFGMLQDAALLHLQILEEALAAGLILKDATPYNVQFRGARPTFIDIGSFTGYVDGAPWAAYRQFCQLFLYPLLLQAYRSFDFQPLLRGSLSGLSPAQCRRLFSWRDVWKKGVLTHVLVHAAMERTVRVEDTNLSTQMRQSGFDKGLILRNVRGLRTLIEGLRWRAASSRWSEYDREPSPVQVDGDAKETLVREIVSQKRRRLAWDLGCNAGRYSRIAAENSDFVVAMDIDHLTVERFYRELRQEGNDRILPLTMNLADPSPSLGWRGRERVPVEQRSRPELVLCLALIHHLVIAENLLLDDVIDWFAELGGALVIEFVDKSDPQVRTLLAQRVDQDADYSEAGFQAALSRRFEIVARHALPSGTRTLYFAEPRA